MSRLNKFTLGLPPCQIPYGEPVEEVPCNTCVWWWAGRHGCMIGSLKMASSVTHHELIRQLNHEQINCPEL